MDKLEEQIDDLERLIKKCERQFEETAGHNFYSLQHIEEAENMFRENKSILMMLDEKRSLERRMKYEEDEVFDSLLKYRKQLLDEKEERKYKRKEADDNGA